ncbi:hypothetical protein PRVXT_002722 [Proteinivorax tanatarense]|uniref:Secreted protein n=1 Tax=Proteinivorax tanatarense TaxID=1260629 RepID=A0AAU7VKS0_9FIRM
MKTKLGLLSIALAFATFISLNAMQLDNEIIIVEDEEPEYEWNTIGNQLL